MVNETLDKGANRSSTICCCRVKQDIQNKFLKFFRDLILKGLVCHRYFDKFIKVMCFQEGIIKGHTLEHADKHHLHEDKPYGVVIFQQMLFRSSMQCSSKALQHKRS